MRTATQEIMRIDLRRRRADLLAAAVFERLWPRINAIHPDDLPDRVARVVHDTVLDVFSEQGVEVVTDHDRAAIGLPPRGPDGWTVEEMAALERRRLELLTAPLVMPMKAHTLRTDSASPTDIE